MRLALTSNRQTGSLMCPVCSTDTQLPGSFYQYSYGPHGRMSVKYYEKSFSISRAQAGNRTRDLWIDSPACYRLSSLSANINNQCAGQKTTDESNNFYNLFRPQQPRRAMSYGVSVCVTLLWTEDRWEIYSTTTTTKRGTGGFI